MKYTIRIMAVGLILASLVYAKSNQAPGSPPFGLSVQGDAKGTKFTGALFAEFYDCVLATGLCDARIVVRLRKGSTTEFETFYDDTTGIDPANPSAAQEAIISLMTPQIIDRFFGNNNGIFTDDPTNLQIKLKSVTEFGELGVSSTDLTTGSQFVLTDLQIAVN